jgi:NhaP-type Na+/H+ or K+/H+ antiporter
VPAAVAGIVVSMGVDHSELVVTTVALAIILTLALQATTKRWLAHRLALVDLPPPSSVSGAPELVEAAVAKAGAP